MSHHMSARIVNQALGLPEFFVNPLYHFSMQTEALWEIHKGRSWLMKFQELGSRDDPSKHL